MSNTISADPNMDRTTIVDNTVVNPLVLTRRAAIQWLTTAALPLMIADREVAHATDWPSCSLDGIVGITSGGVLEKLRDNGDLSLMTLANYVHDELGMELIDLNSRWTAGHSNVELSRAREKAESVGCYFTNLKVNHQFGDIYSSNTAEKAEALKIAKQFIDSAKELGTKWVRFTVSEPFAKNPTSHIELAKYAEQHGIQLLVENNSWIRDHADAIAEIVAAIGENVAACPDTGNWINDEVRAKGLRRSSIKAASCDFKVYEFDANHNHTQYDLKHCFDICWDAGFRGPWVIEFMKEEAGGVATDIVFIRDMLSNWIAQKKRGA